MDGIHASLVTPFTRTGAVDTASLERLARHCLEGGVAGLVALGTTGEPAMLTPEEQGTVLRLCRKVSDEYGVPLTVGCGAIGTETSVRQARECAEIADALLVVVPYYLRPSDEGVREHFAAIGAAVDVPLIPYNIPYRTGLTLRPETLLGLLAEDYVIGMKHCAGAIDADTLTLLAEAGPGSGILCGDDAYLYPMLQLGADGGITASAAIAPAAYAAMADAVRANDVTTAKTLHERLLPVVNALFAEPSPSVLKAALAELGLIGDPYVRRPLRPPGREPVARALAHLAGLSASGLDGSRRRGGGGGAGGVR
ncbi:MAG TPA: dihydrodipicolinate synthase family protein [Streptosporangiaceae bacterium]|nr:dihydrodipicolinate synthase family protein [Streptosporangiaceae bacterium]